MKGDSGHRCFLCDAADTVRPAGFQQRYNQRGGTFVFLSWWECSACRGWFADPPPAPHVIESNWDTVVYADPQWEARIANNKQEVFRKILDGLCRRGPLGHLLDVGCGFGSFLLQARQAGWNVFGCDANRNALAFARERGLDVREGWSVVQCGFPDEQFQAIVANDAFCYSWHPFRDLSAFVRLLLPGGLLAMRLSNKRFVLGLLRRLLPAGTWRDVRLSRILQGQFHSISVSSLVRILRSLGFEEVQCDPRAPTAPLASLSWPARGAYLASSAVYTATLDRVDLSPGVLLFARKR